MHHTDPGGIEPPVLAVATIEVVKTGAIYKRVNDRQINILRRDYYRDIQVFRCSI